MTWLVGLKRSWLRDAVPWQDEAAVLSYTRPMAALEAEQYFIHALDFFPPDLFPHATHVELRMAVAMVEIRNNALLRTRQTVRAPWSVFTPVAGVDESTIRRNDPFFKRDAISQRVSKEMTERFGDLVPLFGSNMLHKTLPLNDKQIFLYHQSHPDCLWLASWIPVNRELVCPEPIYQAVEWLTTLDLLTTVDDDMSQYHALTQTHLSCPVIEV